MNKTLIDKLNLKPDSKTPIWIMRQAGRYLPEYREIRKKFTNFMDFCLTPNAAAEVTIQPLKRFNLDAAIIFADILLIPKALGMKVTFLESHGPILDAINSLRDIKKLTEPDSFVFEKVGQSIKFVKNELDINYKNKTLIGFAGAPFTVAAYMVEGKASKEFGKLKEFIIKNPNEFNELINIIIDATVKYLKIQISNGAEVIKLFDSWSGIVPNSEFKNLVVNPINRIIEAVKKEFPKIPFIVFARCASSNLKNFKKEINKIDAYAIDQYTDLTWAFRNLAIDGNPPVLQGNMDNMLLMHGNKKQITIQVHKILKKAENKHLIFNLGHGILPGTPIDNMKHLVDTVVNYNDGRDTEEN